MDWTVLAIGLIPLGVWIISTIFRGMEDAREQEKQRPDPADRPLKAPRRQSSELDRFLEEARRRRETSPKPPPPVVPVLEAIPVSAAVAPPKIVKKSTKPREKPKPVAPPPPPPPPVVVAETPPPPPAPKRLPPRRPASETLVKVMQMLRSKDALNTAMVLREILDRPISQRPRP